MQTWEGGPISEDILGNQAIYKKNKLLPSELNNFYILENIFIANDKHTDSQDILKWLIRTCLQCMFLCYI